MSKDWDSDSIFGMTHPYGNKSRQTLIPTQVTYGYSRLQRCNTTQKDGIVASFSIGDTSRQSETMVARSGDDDERGLGAILVELNETVSRTFWV